MDFSNSNLWLLFYLGDEPVYVTQTLLSLWIVMGIAIALAVAVRILLRRFHDVPRGVQNLIETAVEMMENLTVNMMGPSAGGFGAYFFGVFGFILLSNYSGLFGIRPPTADLSVTMALALSTFFIVHLGGIVSQRGAYFKEYLQPAPIFLPLNIIGELSKPISLSFRLFGNILGGLIILKLIYAMVPTALTVLLPDILHLYFDLFAGALQAFIFTVLSMTFIQQKAFPQGR